MDSPDPKGAVSRLVAVLRKVTRIVQLLPFVYLLLLSVYLLTEYILPDWVLGIADNVLNAPVVAIIGLLGVGKLLKLCAWFRTACLMPILPKIESWVDSFIVTFTQEEILCINISIGIIALVFLVAAIRHFAYAR
jgi:hypothetical protein